MKSAARAAVPLAGVLVLGLFAAVSYASAQEQKQKPWDGSRATPVHLLPLRDENDQIIVPTDVNPMPYSARTSCGPCHDYKTVQGGWHFAAMTARKNGRPGEPWIWLDTKTGTVLPLSYRKWPGAWDPKSIGLNTWDFTMLFGRHLPGGGPAEPSDDEAAPGADSRWSVSGKAEVNCLACHNKSGRQDESEWAKQMLRENVRWAATAAAGIGEVGGMASRLKSTWDVYDGPNLDDHEWAVAPFVRYRRSDFDSKHRYFFDIAYPPDDKNCLACHSVSPQGEARMTTSTDIHTSRGIKCAECHRNGLKHDMIRGYEGESRDTGDRTADSFTCRGCHMGVDETGEKIIVPGRLGAPYPKHTGFPLVHFKRLSCTVCHSGPVPEGRNWKRVKTSRANRMGVQGVAQWFTDTPAIIEPVYMRNDAGKLEPRRLVWPAFWGRTDGKETLPLQPTAVDAAAGDILKCEDRVAAVLTALSQICGDNEIPAMAAAGWLFELNVDAGLDVSRPAAAKDGGKADASSPVWGTKKDGTMTPFVSDFDPDAADKDPEIEPKIQSVLEALATVVGAPGKPVYAVKKTLYKMEEGALTPAELPAALAGVSGLGWLTGDLFTPLASEFDLRTLTAKAGTDKTLTEEQVILVLKALEAAEKREGKAAKSSPFVYVSGGRVFRLDKDGRLVSKADDIAAPVTWPLAHDVRPLQQSLGWNGCTDCHTADSKFFFKTATATGPLQTKSVASKSAVSAMGVGGLFHRAFGLTFAFRPFFKILLAITILATGAVLVVFLLIVAGKLAGLIEKRS